MSDRAVQTVRLGAGLFLVGLALRPPIVAIGPLTPQIVADLGVSHAAVGLLTTLPILAMGLCSPLGPALAASVGARRAIVLSVATLAVVGIGRAAASEPALLLALTVGVGIVVGAAGSLPSIVARSAAPARAGLAGGVVAAGIVLGAIASATTAVPLADALGGWRAALAVLSLAALASVPFVARLLPAVTVAPRVPTAAWRVATRPHVAALTVVFGLQALVYWTLTAWLPDGLIERGWNDSDAAAMVGLVNAAALTANLTIVAVSDRIGQRRRQILASAGVIALSGVGLAALPSLALIAAAAIGLGLGAIFALLLIATVDAASDAVDAGRIAAVVLGGGYTIAAVGPVALGLLRDLAGGHGLTFGAIAILGLLVAVAAVALQSRRPFERNASGGE